MDNGGARREERDGPLELFLDLVRIDSPTREEADVAAFCAKELAKLGFAVKVDDSWRLTGSNTGNVIAELQGTNARTLVLAAHMDCVAPCRGVEPHVADGIVSSVGDTVLGADDKAGIAAIISAARTTVAQGGPRPTLRVLLTVQEEIGLRGAKALDPALSKADLCLVLDADGPPGTMIVAAPTHYTFVATFEGRGAHAGVAPEKGVNAIVMASNAVAAMALGRLDEETTANVGNIEGGTATNVVPSLVTLTGECRSLSRERVEAVKAEMDAAMRGSAEASDGSVTIDWTLEYESFALEADDPAVLLVSSACRDVGLEPCLKRTGGGSDANVFAARDVPTVALSCGMKHVHSTEERITVSDLKALTGLVRAVIEHMAA